MNAKTKRIAAFAACGVVLLAGLFFYARKQMGYPGTDALNGYTSLGLFMVVFLFFEAVASGALLFAAAEGDAAKRGHFAVVGLVSVVCAGVAVVADCGSPLNLWRLWLSPVVKSPIFLDIVFMTCAVVLSALSIASCKEGREGMAKVARVGCGIAGVVMPLGTSLIFTGMSSALGFESLLEIGYFLLHAVIVGTVVALLVYGIDSEQAARLRKLAALLLGVAIVLFLAEAVLCLYRTDVDMLSVKGLIMGMYAPVFWLNLILLEAVPAVMLFTGAKARLAAVLALVGVFGSKLVFILKGNLYPYAAFGEGIKLPMLQNAEGGYQVISAYVPMVGEWLIAAAVFAVAAAALIAAFSKRPESVDGKE